MNVIRKIKAMLEERRMWKEYIISWEAAKYFGKLIGAKPYFITFDEYKRCCANKEANK